MVWVVTVVRANCLKSFYPLPDFAAARLVKNTGYERVLQHGRDLETWHLEAGRDLGTSFRNSFRIFQIFRILRISEVSELQKFQLF